jgi:CBS-domain-containing membrane protein
MKLWRVDDVMTKDVVAVREDTPYRDVVNLLISRRVSAVPVVDRSDRVVGVVSEADLLHKVERRRPRIIETWRFRRDHAKAAGRVARDVMSAPPVTVLPSLSVAAAARRMRRENVKRLPVEDELGRLVGIVTRSDLLKIHLRSDAEIRRDVVEEVLEHALAVPDGTVQVTAADGIVTLAGRLRFRSAAVRAAGLSREVPGVVDVVNDLTFDIDDSPVKSSSIGVPFVA